MNESIIPSKKHVSGCRNQEGLVDSSVVADMLGITTNTLQIWRHFGRGPRYVKLSRRAVRYRLEDVHEWVSNSMIETEV